MNEICNLALHEKNETFMEAINHMHVPVSEMKKGNKKYVFDFDEDWLNIFIFYFF